MHDPEGRPGPRSPATAAGGQVSFRAMRRRESSVLVGVAALGVLASACSTECQRLCTAWYDYQRDVCGVVQTDDARVTCIADYRLSRTTPDELTECSARMDEVRALGAARDGSCCSWDRDDCPPGPDDDDSAGAGAR